MAIGVGALTTGVLATVDARGRVERDRVTLDWRVHHSQRWIDVRTDTTVRHERAGAAPIAVTSVRVPGGDAVHRVYGVGDHGGVVVVEVENASPEAIGVGFVVDGAAMGAGLVVPRKPGAVEPDGLIVYPVPHRTTLRVVLADDSVDLVQLPDWSAVARGWDAVLDRGMRTELPEPLQTDIDAARADALLAPASAETFLALEDWGFDEAATAMWPRLGRRARRAARRREGSGLLYDTRRALLREDAKDGKELELLPGFRPEWLGRNLAVHDGPLRRGTCSFAVRWHGSRPALLWDAPSGSTIRVPALDPAFVTQEPVGETLLSEPPAALLPMGRTATREGDPIDTPESFS
jgi:hypothetical protein